MPTSQNNYTYLQPFKTTRLRNFLFEEDDVIDISNIGIPYDRTDLTLLPGCLITINGFVLPPGKDDHRVTVNIGSSKVSNCIGLHMNVRVTDRTVVFNSMEGGRWKREVRKECPLQLGRAFTCMILVTQPSFMIAFHDEHFMDFPHRLDLSNLNTLSINGCIKLASVYYDVEPMYCSITRNETPVEQLLSMEYPSSGVIIPLSSIQTKSDITSFLSCNIICEMHFRSIWSSKSFRASFMFCEAESQPTKVLELEFYINHSQGKVVVSTGKGWTDIPLWSLQCMDRCSQSDLFIISDVKCVRMYLNSHCIAILRRDKYVFTASNQLLISTDASLTDVKILHYPFQ